MSKDHQNHGPPRPQITKTTDHQYHRSPRPKITKTTDHQQTKYNNFKTNKRPNCGCILSNPINWFKIVPINVPKLYYLILTTEKDCTSEATDHKGQKSTCRLVVIEIWNRHIFVNFMLFCLLQAFNNSRMDLFWKNMFLTKVR